MRTRFTDIRSKLQVSQELNTASQKNNEDVRTFGSRVQALLCQLNDICISEAGEGSQVIIESLNSQTALISFQEGLNHNIRILVKAANCKTLKESIAKAVEEELLLNRHDSLKNNKNNSVRKCQFCHKNGHTADRCFSIRNNPNRNMKDNNSNSSNKNSESQIKQISVDSSRKLQCSYCKKIGHHIDNCFSRKNSEARKGKNGNNANNKPSTSNTSSNSEKLNVINMNSVNSGNLNRLDQSSLNRAVRAKDL